MSGINPAAQVKATVLSASHVVSPASCGTNGPSRPHSLRHQQVGTVRFDDALNDPAYAGLRDVSQRFRGGVTSLFFDVHPKLPKLIRDFGVF